MKPMGSRFWKSCCIGLGTIATLSPGVMAADVVIFSYPPLERSMEVTDLEIFVETGETTPTLDELFENTALTPRALSSALTREAAATPLFLDRHLNSLAGKFLLHQIGRTIHTPSGDTNGRALRSAMVLAASDDDRFSALEVIQHYPTEEVYVEVRGMVRLFRNIEDIFEDVGDVLSSQHH